MESSLDDSAGAVEYMGTVDFVSRLWGVETRIVEGEDDMDVAAIAERVFIEFADVVLESFVSVAGKTSLFVLFSARNAVLFVNDVPRPILLGARLPRLILHRAGPVRIRVAPVEVSLTRPLVPDMAYRRPCSLSKILAIFPLDFASREECSHIRPHTSEQITVLNKLGMFSNTYYFRVSNATMCPPKASSG
jgi:hypothetical protein